MRVLYAGSPAIAIPSLLALSDMELKGKDIILAGILTNPDTSRKKEQKEPSDLSSAALELDLIRKKYGLPPIPQVKAEKIDKKIREEIAVLKPDLLVSFACRHFFGSRFLSIFPLGGINIHPSLLPKYRGASPIPAVILAGEKETGICIQKLAPEIDAGEILAEDRFSLGFRETALSLGETAGRRAALLLCELLPGIADKTASARPQEGEICYCREIKKEDGIIDWSKTAVEIDAQIRAYTPWPLSSCRAGKDTLIILEAQVFEPGEKQDALPKTAPPGTVLGMDKNTGILIQTGNGILAVTRLQWQAKKAMDFKAFCNGARGFIGSTLCKP